MAEIPNHQRPSYLKYWEAQHDRRSYLLPAGVTLEDVLADPNFWGSVMHIITVGTMIEVCSLDFSVDVDLRVVAIDPYKEWAEVVVRGTRQPEGVHRVGVDGQGFRVVAPAASGAQTWRVARGKEIVARDLESEAAAHAKLEEIRNSMRRGP